RGSNGVVLITTKRGKAGEMKINYSLGYSIQTAPKEQDVMNLQQYAQMENEYKAISGGTVREDFLDPSILGAGTNWQGELFQSAAMLKNQITLSGGTEKAAFYLSGERMNQDGVALGSGFDRSSVRLNLDIKPRDWFYMGTNLSYAQTDEELASNNVSGSNLIVNAIQLGPQVPVKNPDGTFGGGSISNSTAEQFSPVNPVALANVATNDMTRRRLLAGVDAGIKVLNGLELKTSFSTTVEFSNSTYYLPTYKFGYQENTVAFLDKRNTLSNYWNWNQTLQYTKQLGKHHIYAMATHEAQKSTYENLQGTISGFLTNEILDLNAGNAATAANAGGQNTWAMESYLGRINYNFDNRYIVTGAVRWDGSAFFGPENKWGRFLSGSGAWRISEEKFFTMPQVSDLRLRYEIGATGNQGNTGNAIYGTFAKAIPTEWGSGFRPANFSNPAYQWEETYSHNFGLTLGLFTGRIQLDLDYYIKYTDNLILPSELPWSLGTRGDASIAPPTVNIGSLENKGWGVSITTRNIERNGFKWDTNFNISGFITEVTSLSTGNHITREGPDWFLANFAQRTQVGYAPWQFLGYIEEGLFQSEEEILNSARPADNNGPLMPAENGIWVGDVKYKDVSGPEGVPDGIINDLDRTLIGNPYPKWFGGITNSFSYKGFDVSILLTYSYGNQIYNYLLSGLSFVLVLG
ncbi:MAG TPA: SusC/RagA family TonB-linked outer membrane protein, partial [Tenuifilaceae bacterium]|nr:SusC/RagA family TonB-linked outer membrane protein [Tenuifilaceae bacterium]